MQIIRASVEAGDQLQKRSAGLKAEAMLRSRRARDTAFSGYPDGFGEPAWDALLLLYAEAAKGRAAVPKGELTAEARVRSEISHPYIGWLASHQLVAIEGEDVALTEQGREMMTAYLDGEEGVHDA